MAKVKKSLASEETKLLHANRVDFNFPLAEPLASIQTELIERRNYFFLKVYVFDPEYCICELTVPLTPYIEPLQLFQNPEALT